MRSTKNHQALLSTPSENLKANSMNASTDEPDSKDYSNHSSSNYERKKNIQNSNRKPYAGGGGGGGSYRGNPNIGLNSHSNSNSASINHSIGQSNISGPNHGMRKGPLIHHPIPESSGNSHIYTSGAGHHHAENTPPPYNRANSTHNSKLADLNIVLNSLLWPKITSNSIFPSAKGSSASQIEHTEKRPINHNKPLIATLPTLSNVHNHYDRTRAPRPKPLDLRRNVSNRNTPSTNSTESNNSPNSIVSSDHHHSQNHYQQVKLAWNNL